MSVTRKNLILVGITAIVAGAGYYSWTNGDHEVMMSPVHVQAKSNVALNISINAPEGLSSNPDKTTKLEAVVEKFVEMGAEPVTYHWYLPKGVSIQSGELSGVILGLKDNSATITISVQGLTSQEAQNIQLDLNTDMNGQMVGATGSFSTQVTNPDLSVSPREPASKGFFKKAGAEAAGKKGLPPKGVHF